ncbi:hypothetical protein [Calothrix sp. 336/3]|nr:hypothetical protein [Calothrix sp. 336/3]
MSQFLEKLTIFTEKKLMNSQQIPKIRTKSLNQAEKSAMSGE